MPRRLRSRRTSDEIVKIGMRRKSWKKVIEALKIAETTAIEERKLELAREIRINRVDMEALLGE